MTSLILACLLAQSQPDWNWAPVAPLPQPERPRDVWAFRSVLDGNARIATFALREGLWAAYDTKTGRLYKAWNGGVRFDGAVYTSAHGPQPTSQGFAYTEGSRDGWTLASGGSETELNPVWKGMTFTKAGRVYMTYEAQVGRRTIRLEEMPEAQVTPTTVTFHRIFRASGIRPGEVLRFNFGVQNAMEAPEISASNSSVSDLGGGEFIGSLQLPSGRHVRLSTRFRKVDPGAETPPVVASLAPAAPEVVEAAEDQVPGLAMRVYALNRSISRLPQLVPG
ncbi:MAG: hypothetical protein MH204_09910, partial [Fimbriimonadaceae bacterium]|nr:hypothetical protein [Fimbriimonadaceae bacterium]